MNQILEQLGTYGIVPVVVLQDAAKAEPLAEALCKGGLACAEVTSAPMRQKNPSAL